MFVDLPGEVASLGDLRSPKARDLATRMVAHQLPYVTLVECRRTAESDIVVFDAEPEVPQIVECDIRQTERLAACFSVDDRAMPEVLALREDFPATGHMIPPVDVVPRQLCLFEESYSELKLRWTSKLLVVQILDWLRLTARGELHAADQPLEQALAGHGDAIFLPRVLADPDHIAVGAHLRVRSAHEDNDRFFVDLVVRDSHSGPIAGGFVVVQHVAKPRTAGPIRVSPKSLADLDELLAGEFLDPLREQLLQFFHSDKAALDSKLMLVVRIPLQRQAAGKVERLETWAFVAGKAGDVGIGIGLWSMTPNGPGLLLPIDRERPGSDVGLLSLAVYFKLSREAAAYMNGRSVAEDRRFLAVGAGALGSQVILNAARAAYGRWTVVDRDRMLPHNFARHGLINVGLGHRKALALATVANGVFDSDDVFDWIVADVLSPGAAAESLATRIQAVDAILDFSASVPVARHLCLDVLNGGRRVSFFLNPTGTDLVMLAEDGQREFKLDALEMQYYRALLRDGSLSEHLSRAVGPLRYAQSCRDVTFQLPQERVALHAAVAMRNLRAALDDGGAAIRLWRLDPDCHAVAMVSIEVRAVREHPCGEWTVVYDEGVVETIRQARSERLPRETGGVLVGAFDLQRRRIYVVDTIASPPDSDERETLYIRGHAGLLDAVKAVGTKTLGQLTYVGEWHSHPPGHPALPSKDDLDLLGWLTEHMTSDGLPGVMMIVSDYEHSFLLANCAEATGQP